MAGETATRARRARQARTLAQLWQTFAAKAQALGATVEYVEDERAAAARLAPVAPRATRCVLDAFPQVAGVCPAMAAVPPPPARAQHEVGAEVAGAALFAIAETGSLVVADPAGDRAACFLADRLWLLVPHAEIVATLDEALARLGELICNGARYATIMSGPSRTADIERTLTIGVHGPRALAILVVGRARRRSVPRSRQGRETPPAQERRMQRATMDECDE
jgi:L-lactate dehydrogenase complex protein LldG